jgi:UDP-N-acetylmuramoyl-tripeptide--D-alanyl-D-alanine ligase
MDKRVLWRWEAACTAVGASPQTGPDIFGVSTDTRTLEPGDLFVALPGDPGPRFNTHHRSKRDGHDHVADAAARGAAGALVHRVADVDLPQILTHDSLDALWALGRAARERLGSPVFGVTGSSGKTTVKTLLAAALDCPSSAASFNNYLGVPLSLARTPHDAPAAVFEIGTNHPGEIAPLAELVRPDVALVLNVMPAHIENFAGMDALRREKLSIVQGLRPGGTLVLPDTLAPWIDDAGAHRSVVTFGESSTADVTLVAYDPGQRTASIRWRLSGSAGISEGSLRARVPGGGHHRALSITATVACLLAAGFDPAVAAALEDHLIPAGRGRIHDVGGISLIDDSYNANPVSMISAIDEVARMAASTGGRAYAILGEMLELGAASERYHRDLLEPCRALDGVLCAGTGMQALFDVLPADKRIDIVTHAAEIDVAALAARFRSGDYLLVKGSNRVFWVHDFVPRLLAALGRGADKSSKAER